MYESSYSRETRNREHCSMGTVCQSSYFNCIYIGPFHNKCEMFYMRHSAKLTIAFGHTVSWFSVQIRIIIKQHDRDKCTPCSVYYDWVHTRSLYSSMGLWKCTLQTHYTFRKKGTYISGPNSAPPRWTHAILYRMRRATFKKSTYIWLNRVWENEFGLLSII